ncbi:MAG TPA: hypothetical protein DCR69_09910 [Clostridium sp.]|nr:hypothetical protein [Clostridium sp.]
MKNIIVYCILAVVNLITYPLKVKSNKITFICYCSDKLKRDFKLISKKLEKEDSYELVYVLTNYENSLKGNVAFLFNCMKQVYHVNTSKVVLLDYNNFVVSNFKKKEVKVIQVWHACGAIKKFGNDIEREYPIKNYDYVLATSEEWKKHYSTAFGVSENSVLPIGIPLTDNLFSKEKMKKYKRHMLKKFPSIKGKKVIVYAPTFRGDPIYDIKYQDINLQYLKEQLGDEYVIIYKLHPSLGDRVIVNDESIIDGNSESIKRLFSIADYLISDYSSVIFDFSIMKKPMIFFVPDLEQYKKERGIYMDYEETMPGPICKTEEEIVQAILSEISYSDKIEEFKNKYFKYQDGKSTERVVELIVNLCKGVRPK